MNGFQFDCDLCDETVQAATIEALKEQGTAHLGENHDGELTETFSETYGGEPCRNDCGYIFPVGVEKVAGFDCPECGHDHFPTFADQYLFWQIEDV